MDIRLLVFEECPNSAATLDVLKEVLETEGVDDPVKVIEVPNLESARREGSLGSPTIQIDGLDIETRRRGELPTHGCRIYQTESGSGGVPSKEMIRQAIHRAQAPKQKILFLCTGNSCRSQMAEGWTRALKGDVIEAYSAGIETHGLNSNAVKVMSEAGVDISKHHSKNVKELMDVPFDYVVTVCGHANETCPMFPGKAKVVHVGFDDPPALAKQAGTEEEALDCYRRVCDEIRAFVETLPESLEKKG